MKLKVSEIYKNFPAEHTLLHMPPIKFNIGPPMCDIQNVRCHNHQMKGKCL